VALRLLLATRNRGKIAEIGAILSGAPVEIVSAGEVPRWPEPAETGETFLENALIKARAAHEATGLAALADDSGLEVAALGGDPGVTSARYGGEGLDDRARAARLLEALEGVPEAERGARFRCVMVLFPAPGRPGKALVTEGILEGRIAAAASGENGFGYDPVFVPHGETRTLAEMGAGEKNAISHRYRALEEMRALLEGGVPGTE
jgi:XTP/dITP diphosphohydrolase